MTEYKNRSMIQRRLIPSYIFLTIVSFLSVFPLYWMITAATNKSVDVARGKIVFGNYLMENWTRLNQLQDLGGAMKNSFIYAAVQTVLAGPFALRYLFRPDGEPLQRRPYHVIQQP